MAYDGFMIHKSDLPIETYLSFPNPPFLLTCCIWCTWGTWNPGMHLPNFSLRSIDRTALTYKWEITKARNIFHPSNDSNCYSECRVVPGLSADEAAFTVFVALGHCARSSNEKNKHELCIILFTFIQQHGGFLELNPPECSIQWKLLWFSENCMIPCLAV